MWVLLCLRFLLVIYCALKQAIPIINPGVLDEDLLTCERIIHFGIVPSLLFVNILKNHESIVSVLDKIYFSWYFVKVIVFSFIVFYFPKRKRIVFFYSYFLIWILGGSLAILFPSWGPIYYKPHWFTEILPHARFANVLQKILWDHYLQIIKLSKTGDYIVYIYEGIAAIPSLHVATVALYFFFFKKWSRWVASLALSYLCLIQFGSFVLGWHYAIDGYLGILIAWAVFGQVSYVMDTCDKYNVIIHRC